MERVDIHKHFDHIIKYSKNLESVNIVNYIDNLSGKIGIPFEDIIEEFVFHWEKVNKKDRVNYK